MADGAPDVGAIRRWLIEGADPARRPEEVLAGLCERLSTAGLALHRVAVFVRTLHPNVMGRRFLWKPGQDVMVSEADYAVLDRDTFRRSSVRVVFEQGVTVRRRIADPDGADDFNIIAELRAEGVSDYLLQPLRFSNGETHAVSWTTCRAGGFSDAEVEALTSLLAPFARVAEIFALRRVATTLLDTYVGHVSGEQVLAGRIRRGDLEHIEAVILLSDLRGFTRLSDRHPGETVIAMLNRYFDCLVPPIIEHRGEVLKFTGDGLLAIFPITGDPAPVCTLALHAAGEACRQLAGLREEGAPVGPLRMGLALHVGEVLYGNIGSHGRLDFTAIGPAVNLTARLESATRELGRELVVSAAFARHCKDTVEPLGEVALRGFDTPQAVFAPRGGTA